jgi:NAD(P)-dependent dehydrogenase (short-subunit alcohol dehydrogenase family)
MGSRPTVSADDRRQVLLITGAASGIGAATARAFARNGYAVAMGDVAAEGLRGVEEELITAGAEAAGVVADVTDPAAVARLVAVAVERFGDLDVVCPNAGVFVPEAPLVEMTDGQFEALIAVNLRGVFNVLRAALRTSSTEARSSLRRPISGSACALGRRGLRATKILDERRIGVTPRDFCAPCRRRIAVHVRTPPT